MANENNLKKGEVTQYRSGEEAARNGRKGGKASGRKRREQRTVREILRAVLDGKIKDNQQFAKLAEKLGISDKKSVKEVYTLVCLLNSVKKGDLSDLEKLARLLGEDNANEVNNGILDELTEYLKNV